MLIEILKSRVPKDRYILFLRGNILVFAGYTIATIETIIAIYLGITPLSYEVTLYISLSILSLTSILIIFTILNKSLLVWQEWTIFGIYLITFLIAFSIWVFWLGDLRILGILNALTAVTIVLSYTNVIQSLLMSLPTLACYFSVTWYAIKIAGQSGSIVREAFFTFCLFPAFLLISSAAYYMNKKRKDLQRIKSELEVINFNLSEVNEKLKNEQLLTEIEMELASEIQQAIFPVNAPVATDWSIALFTKPFGAVSGDFYDFYCTDNLLNGLAIFDVSGHGVAPALITILAKPVLYNHFKRLALSPLDKVLEAANSELIDELAEVNLYITGIVVRINGTDIEYVNAGHPDLLYFKKEDRLVCQVLESIDNFKGHPIGVSPSSEKYKSFEFTVSSGDCIVLYSDGLTEARNQMGVQFGKDRLIEVIASTTEGSAESILRNILYSFKVFTEDVKAGDDITIIVAQKL